ncbi:MAG: class II aldolase/adducin family protein [Candidatus Zixiibacteriota bacterium]
MVYRIIQLRGGLLRTAVSGLPQCGDLVDFPAAARYFAAGMDSARKQRKQLIEVGKRLTKMRMVAGSDGNLSARLENGHILITPSGVPLGDLDADDLVMVDLHGTKLDGDGEPSSELATHLYLYKSRPDIQAVVHAHPPYATAFAVAGVEMEWRSLPEMVVLVGPVALTEYAPPGTEAVPKALEPFFANHDAFLLRNHGLVTVGRSVMIAWQRHEIVEHAARILHLSRTLGGPQHIPGSDFERLENLRNTLTRERD